MKKITRLSLCVALTLLLVGAYFVVSAASSQPVGPPRSLVGANVLRPQSQTNYEGLRANFITSYICSTPCVLGAGFTIEDNVQFQCGSTGASTCSLVVNSYATTSGGGTASDNRALCLVLDDYIVGSCAFDGYDASDGSYSSVNATNNVSGIPTGNHSAFVAIYSDYGTSLYTFTNQYSVLKP